MRIALVHDYLSDFGGAERVLKVLSEMYPEAPIYTAFYKEGTVVAKEFSGKTVIESKWAWLLKRGNLYSPLRFLLPWIWGGMDLSAYDLVITSCSGYIARGFRMRADARLIAYCHTPPRFLYGLQTSFDWQRHWYTRMYAAVVNHFLRVFDAESAQRVDRWLVNSENVRARVKKFYRRTATVVYPPVEVEKIKMSAKGVDKEDYFLIVSRLVGAKGLEEAALAAHKLGFDLWIAGEEGGIAGISQRLLMLGSGSVRLLGRVDDNELYKLYAGAKGFIALARNEDFGMTVVEALAAGTPVLAYAGGGFLETVRDGETGVFITKTTVDEIGRGMRRLEEISWSKRVLTAWVDQFSRMKFEEKIKAIVKEETENARTSRSRDNQ